MKNDPSEYFHQTTFFSDENKNLHFSYEDTYLGRSYKFTTTEEPDRIFNLVETGIITNQIAELLDQIFGIQKNHFSNPIYENKIFIPEEQVVIEFEYDMCYDDLAFGVKKDSTFISIGSFCNIRSLGGFDSGKVCFGCRPEEAKWLIRLFLELVELLYS